MSALAPFTFGEARAAHDDASREQESAEDALGGANAAFARAEEAYRKALALEMWRLRREEKVAWTSIGDLARGAAHVAALKAARDDAEGAATIASHAVYRRSADRRDTERFIEWSMRRDLAEGYGRTPAEPADPQVYGRKAA